MKIYVIFHEEQDKDLENWEVCDFEAFFDKNKAEERAKKLTEDSAGSFWGCRFKYWASEMEVQ